MFTQTFTYLIRFRIMDNDSSHIVAASTTHKAADADKTHQVSGV